jgi:hypothetical protein
MWRRPHALAALRGTLGWKHYQGVFEVAPDAASVVVALQLAETTGTLRVRGLSLVPVTEKPTFGPLRAGSIFVWSVLGLWVTLPMLRSAAGNARQWIVLGLGLVILCAVLMPEALKESMGSSLFPSLVEASAAPLAEPVFRFTPLLPDLNIFKAGHFLLFALLSMAALHRAPYAASCIRVLGCLILFALVTEILQLFVSGRSAQIGDVIVNGAGTLAGLGLLAAMRLVLPARAR